MNLLIGENIRRMRRERNLTQEETEAAPEYLDKADQILDILFDGEESDFIKSIRKDLRKVV